jgi:hypothetical protein
MKKRKMIAGLAALLLIAGSSYAYSKYKALPGNLFYRHPETKECVNAPCETINRSGTGCKLVVYSDDQCSLLYTTGWATRQQ